MKLNKIFIAFLAVIIILCGIAFSVYKNKKPNWQPVKHASVVSAIYGLGTVEANRSFNLVSGVTNYIQKIYVNLGENVKQGQRLVSYRDGHSVASPFAGVVTAKMSNVDEIVSPQTNVLTVTDLSDLYILVSLDQDSLLKLHQIKQIKINFEALPDTVFTGKVAAIYSHDNNFYVRIIPQDLPAKILPGMTADVALVTNAVHNSLLVPLAAVQQGKVTYQVNKKITTVNVQIGTQENSWGQVTSNNIPANALVRVN